MKYPTWFHLLPSSWVILLNIFGTMIVVMCPSTLPQKNNDAIGLQIIPLLRPLDYPIAFSNPQAKTPGRNLNRKSDKPYNPRQRASLF